MDKLNKTAMNRKKSLFFIYVLYLRLLVGNYAWEETRSRQVFNMAIGKLEKDIIHCYVPQLYAIVIFA